MLQMKLCGDLVLREKCVPVDDISADILSAMDEMVRMTHWVGGGPLTRDRYRLTDDDLAEILLTSLER